MISEQSKSPLSRKPQACAGTGLNQARRLTGWRVVILGGLAVALLAAIGAAWSLRHRNGVSWAHPASPASGRFEHLNAAIPLADLPCETLVARFLDRARPFAERQACARQLAELKTAAALQALIAGFRLEQGEERRAIARLMGQTRDPIFEPSLLSLLETGDDADASVAIQALGAIGGESNLKRLAALMEDDGWPDALRTEAAIELLKTGDATDAQAAVRGLAAIGGDACTAKLAEIALAERWPENLRLEAALGLGQIGSTRAGDALVAVYWGFADPEIRAQLLDALGHFPFPQIESTWRQVLDAPDTPEAVRTAAVEALANSTHEAVPFLQAVAGSDGDVNVREMAAWALSAHGPDGELGPALSEMSRVEPEPDVRRRLYEACMAQADNPAEGLLPLIRAESDTAARIAGFNAVGDAVRRGQSPALAAEFDQQIAPELTQIAMAPGNLNLRMRAVFALRRASTPAALAALTEISKTPTQQIAQAAINGLQINTGETGEQ